MATREHLRQQYKCFINNPTRSLGMKLATALSVVILLLSRVPTVYAQVPTKAVLEPVDNSIDYITKPIIPLTQVTPEPPKKIKKKATVKHIEAVVASSPVLEGNTYSAGWCTWFVKNQRPDLPNGLHNASQWLRNAQNLGMAVGTEPRVGAVIQTRESKLGHVALVTSVTDDSIGIVEMNYRGRYVVSTRIIPIDSKTIVGFIY